MSTFTATARKEALESMGFTETDEWLAQQNAHFRHCTYVSCWSACEEESAIMWHAYIGRDDGVAIRSTVRRLLDSTKQFEFPVGIRRVQYLDWDKVLMPMDDRLRPLYTKRKQFQDEREMRALHMAIPEGLLDPPPEPPSEEGIPVPVDLAVLVEEVRVSPFAVPWLRDVVISLLARYELDAPVKPSALSGEPQY